MNGSMNSSYNNSMRTARPSPSANLSMSQTRGRTVVDKLSSDKISNLLDRCLQDEVDPDQDQIGSARTPAINKENNSTQAGRVRDEHVEGEASPEASGYLASSGGFGRPGTFAPADRVDGSGAASMPGHGSVSLDPFAVNQTDTSIPATNDTRRDASSWGASMPVWTKDHGDITFTSALGEPQGLEIPQGFEVRKNFGDGQYTEVKFLESYDMPLGQAEGEGGNAVADNVLRFLKLEKPGHFDPGTWLQVPMEFKLRANGFKRLMATDRGFNMVKGEIVKSLEPEGWELAACRYDAEEEHLILNLSPQAQQA